MSKRYRFDANPPDTGSPTAMKNAPALPGVALALMAAVTMVWAVAPLGTGALTTGSNGGGSSVMSKLICAVCTENDTAGQLAAVVLLVNETSIVTVAPGG